MAEEAEKTAEVEVEAQDTAAEGAESTAEAQVEEPKGKAAKTEKATQEAADAAEDGKTEVADWRDGVTDPKLRKLADRFETPEKVFKSLEDLRKQISDRIKVPGEDASDEEVQKFRKAIGIPEKAEDYKVEFPEGVELNEAETALFDALKPMAHEANVPAGAFAQFAVKFKEFEQQLINEDAAQKQKAVEESEAELKKEWGGDFDANRNIANRAMKDFAKSIGRDDLIEFVSKTELKDGRFVGDHPEMVRLFAHLGRRMSEDGVMEPVDSDQKESLMEEREKLTAQAHAARAKGDTAAANRLFQKRAEITARLEGEAPIVGSSGRAA